MAETSDSEPMETIGADGTNGVGSGNKSEGTLAPNDSGSSTPKKAPVKCQACTSCRQKKIRCDGKKPTCSACIRSSGECLYVPSRRRGRPARAHREYERPYANPLPILPRQPRIAPAQAQAQTQTQTQSQGPTSSATNQQPASRTLPTLPHLQPSQAGQGTMPPPPPTAPIRVGSAARMQLPPIMPPPQPHTLSYSQNQNQNQFSDHSQNQHRAQAQTQAQTQTHGQGSIAPLGSILAAALFPGSPHSTSEDDGGQSGHRSSGSESPLPHHVRPPAFLVPGGERGGHQSMAQATPLVIPRPSQMLSAGTSSYMDPNIVEFFHYFNALFPIVHWPSFKEAYDDGTVPNYLILAIRALSKRYSKQPSVVLSGQLYAAGQDLAAIATSLAEVATREDPNTYLIQTWIVLSMFEFGMGRLKQAADRRELAVR
ncbi:hypothetical protein LPJ75_005097 [Coemansia sp. RSA 2598]|nr:hypothetical protein LPJ75_005097 [Coemansia sp. RSA 2598]